MDNLKIVIMGRYKQINAYVVQNVTWIDSNANSKVYCVILGTIYIKGFHVKISTYVYKANLSTIKST